MPRGGARPNSGPKPNPNSQRSRRRARQSATVLHHPSVPASTVAPPTTNGPVEVEEFDAPDSLSADGRKVWMLQAPHAFKNGTLKRSTAMSFERYCEVAVLERNEARSSAMGGANHRGLLRQINAYELQFLLTPAGKPVIEPAKSQPVDEDEAFFGGTGVGGR